MAELWWADGGGAVGAKIAGADRGAAGHKTRVRVFSTNQSTTGTTPSVPGWTGAHATFSFVSKFVAAKLVLRLEPPSEQVEMMSPGMASNVPALLVRNMWDSRLKILGRVVCLAFGGACRFGESLLVMARKKEAVWKVCLGWVSAEREAVIG